MIADRKRPEALTPEIQVDQGFKTGDFVLSDPDRFQ